MTPAAKIGLLMIVALIILGVFIIKIEDIPVGERGERFVVEARFASAAGIDRKAAVRIAGVRVGKVEEVRLDGSEAVLVLSLDPEVRLHEGASAQVTSMGMLGDKYVEVLPGDPSAPPLPPGVELGGTTSPSFDDVMRAADEIGADVKEVTAALRGSIGGDRGADTISEIVENIRELTASLKLLIEQNQVNVNETTANFRDFSATLRDELPVIAEKMNRLADQLSGVVDENEDNVQVSLENIRELSVKLQDTADNLNTITGKIASGEGSIGKLVNDDATVDNLNTTLDSIQGGIGTLNETMGRYKRYNLDMNIRGEALPEHSESRVAFGFDLWTTPYRFFRIEGVDVPFGKTKSTTRIITTENPDGTVEEVIETTDKVEDDITFNLQIGYRVLPSTVVRAGIFESAGGVGIDYRVPRTSDKFRLSLEAYDFNRPRDLAVHMRLEGRYFLNRNLFLMAGWDDPLESLRSSVLIGGGVIWRDEDVKYSLGLAAGAAN
jgi:phospholipid/cholesterol/gamma-HCH transport system substrate-binding protein